VAYDTIQVGWSLACVEQARRIVVRLDAFRELEELPGAVHPALFRVAYRCPACRGRHLALIAGGDLDVAPLREPPPPYYDPLLGHMTWDGDAVSELWLQSIRRHRWPLVFQCCAERRAVPGWPSALRVLEPDREERTSLYRVAYRCPSCGEPGCEEWAPARLSLVPRAA
jgi:hypothetical protein